MKKYEITTVTATVCEYGYELDGTFMEPEERGPQFYNMHYPVLATGDGDFMGVVVHRIRALRDMPEIGVKAGQFGGYIEEEGNLSQRGNCWVHDGAVVYNGGEVCGDAQVRGSAVINGGTIGSNAEVSDRAYVLDTDVGIDANISGSATTYRGCISSSTLKGDACALSDYNQGCLVGCNIATGVVRY